MKRYSRVRTINLRGCNLGSSSLVVTPSTVLLMLAIGLNRLLNAVLRRPFPFRSPLWECMKLRQPSCPDVTAHGSEGLQPQTLASTGTWFSLQWIR